MARPKGTAQFHLKDYREEIMAWIAEGKPLREYCRQEGKPCKDVVYRWLDADHEFQRLFARAREQGEDEIALDALRIADDTSNDTLTDDKGNERPNSEWIARSRLRVETRLKLLAKWNPKKWGDRQEVQHGGNVSVTVVTGVPGPAENSKQEP